MAGGKGPNIRLKRCTIAGTLENTIFWWHNHTFVLENIGCNYADHAGEWFPAFKGHSYARVRDFENGAVVANLTSSIGFGFVLRSRT